MELAKMLAQQITGRKNAVLFEENIPGTNRSADIWLKMENQQGVLIELEILIRGHASSAARKVLSKEMEGYSKHGLSHGVVMMLSDNGTGWFADEKNRILQN